MYVLTVKRGIQVFRFTGRNLLALQAQAGEYDSAEIVDASGNIVYSLDFRASNGVEARNDKV